MESAREWGMVDAKKSARNEESVLADCVRWARTSSMHSTTAGRNSNSSSLGCVAMYLSMSHSAARKAGWIAADMLSRPLLTRCHAAMRTVDHRASVGAHGRKATMVSRRMRRAELAICRAPLTLSVAREWRPEERMARRRLSARRGTPWKEGSSVTEEGACQAHEVCSQSIAMRDSVSEVGDLSAKAKG